MGGMRRYLRWGGFALTLAVAALVAAPGWAQTDVTMGRIAGTVRDTGGGALPGATVEALNQDTGLRLRAVSDTTGFYNILNVPIGVYTLTASMPGFQPVSRADVRLALGSALSVDFSLQQGTFSETLTVTSEVPLVEVSNTTVGTTVLNEQLANLPINGRNFFDAVLLTPEARRESQRNYLSLSGQRGLNTNVTVDGVDFNNAFFGGVSGDAEGRAPLNISQESVKEFSVITNGASAEFGRSGGGFVNVITKSGTNDFHGSAFYYNQPQSMIANFPDGRKPADQKKEQYGFSFGGPFIKDKLFFFTSFDKQKQNVTIPISTTNLNPDVFAKYPVLSSPSEYVQTRDGKLFFGRLDYQPTASHRFMIRGNYADYQGVNGTSSSSVRTESYNGVEGMFARTYVGSYSGVFSQNLINDTNLEYIIEDTPRADKGLNLPDIQVTTGALRFGEVSFLPIKSTNTRKSVAESVSYMMGQHVLKGGGEYNYTDITQVFKGNWRGVYIFSTVADLLAGKWNEYRQFLGLNGLTADQAGNAAFAQKELAFFVQDQWFINPSLSFSAGLRWEREDNPNFGILNPKDMNANGSFKLSSKIPDTNNQWSPRLGLTWSPLDKTIVRASAGRYWSRTPGLLFAQTNTSNGYRATQYIVRAGSSGPTGSPAPPWGDGWDPVTGFAWIDPSLVSSIAKPGVFTFDPNFKNAHTDRITLEGERELFANTALTLGVTYAKATDLEYLTDYNLQYQCADGTLGVNCTPKLASNGLPLYSTTRPYPYYDRVNMYASGASSKYWGITAMLQRRFVERLYGLVSVTWSEDKDNDSNERNYSGLFIEDKRNLDNNWAWSDRDQRWKIAANGTWNMPWWGFVFSGFYRYNTGQPYTALANSDLNSDGDRGTDRPTVNGVHIARNSFRQPDYWQIDLRLAKKFTLGPGDISLVAECFNVTDEAWYIVSNATSVWGTGATPGSSFGATSYNGTPRTFQLSLRYDF